jgi:PAS domain S-box-containing protein
MGNATMAGLGGGKADPRAVVLADGAGAIVSATGDVEPLLGCRPEALTGRDLYGLVSDDHAPALRAALERSREGDGAELAVSARRSDGQEVPLSVRLASVDAPGGRLVVALLGDRRTRPLLEDLPRRLLDAAPDAMIVTGPDGRIVLANDAAERVFGHARAALLGMTVEDLMPARLRAMHARQRAGYTRAPHVRPLGAPGLSLLGMRADGTEFPAEISLSALQTPQGVFTIAVIRDITERTKAEEARERLARAEEALRLRDEFLTIASHELRTPLTALQLQIDHALRSVDRATAAMPVLQKVAAQLNAIRRSAARMNKLVDQLLDLSRIATGRLQLAREETDLVAVTRAVIAQFEEIAARYGCEARLFAAEPVRGSWDPMRVEQVITNLLFNAFKFGGGKPVEVTVSGDEHVARLAVRDHGAGIAPEHHARIFERFERVAAASADGGGFGLGLWIARQIVEAHEGTIRVASEPGAGATFTVELPR